MTFFSIEHTFLRIYK